MDAKAVAVAVVAVLGVMSTGCQSDCEKVCEFSKDCSSDGFDGTFLEDASCSDLCDLSEDFAELVNCEGAWDDFVGCTADALPDEGCQVTSAASCRAESEAYSQCFDVDDN